MFYSLEKFNSVNGYLNNIKYVWHILVRVHV